MTKPQLVGILNTTPDSFHDGGKYYAHEHAIARGLELIEEGADMLDIGGESTRPGAVPVSIEEELERVIPVIQALRKTTHIPISIDTYKPLVAKKALHAGATLINDVTGFQDIEMQNLALQTGLSICVMHMKGEPATMQNSTDYSEDIIAYLLRWFEDRTKVLLKKGIKKEQIILDPGIGFGKTVAHNVRIIENLPKLKTLGFPLYIGLSRKSFIKKILCGSTQNLLPGTLLFNSLAIKGGADFIRVHDVAEHRQLIDLLEFLKETGSGDLP